MPDRDQQNLMLLREAAWYGLVLHELAYAIFGEKDFGALFKKAPWSAFLSHHHKKSGDALPGGVSYITPTLRGLAYAGFSKDRLNNSNAAIAQRLPVSWFCHADEPRHLLSSDEAKTLLGAEVPNNLAFVIASERGQAVIYRVYVSATDVSQSVQQVKAIRQDLEKSFAHWLASGQLGVAVLCETPDKVAAIREAVHRRISGPEALADDLRLHVGLGPSPDTVADALKARRRKAKR